MGATILEESFSSFQQAGFALPTEEHFSAGGVVYRESERGIEVILCGRVKPLLWSLPKGTPDDGESPEATALREVREETGLQIAIERDLGEIEYWFQKPGARVHKRVKFYLMIPTGGSVDDHDPEFDRVEWFEGEQALATMTYTNEKEVMERALRFLRERKARGVTASQ